MCPARPDQPRPKMSATPAGHHGRRAELRLNPVPDSVPMARRFVAALDFTGQADKHRLTLLTAEIVTNAVLHARTALTLEAAESPRGVRVSVTDGASSPPVLKEYGTTSPTGRGLHILQAMADRWGFDPSDSGKTVWFELDEEDPGN